MDNPEFMSLVTEAFSAKVWDECQEAFNNLPRSEQFVLLQEFEAIITEHGMNSREVGNYFDTLSMKFSKTYYFVNAMVGSEQDNWDKALEELS